jgi:hypothetical protein
MSWWDKLFEQPQKTPEQDLVLWAQRWRGKGVGDPELRGCLVALLNDLSKGSGPNPYQGAKDHDDWKP